MKNQATNWGCGALALLGNPLPGPSFWSPPKLKEVASQPDIPTQDPASFTILSARLLFSGQAVGDGCDSANEGDNGLQHGPTVIQSLWKAGSFKIYFLRSNIAHFYYCHSVSPLLWWASPQRLWGKVKEGPIPWNQALEPKINSPKYLHAYTLLDYNFSWCRSIEFN